MIDKNLTIIYVTGKSGSGKSKLLGSAKKQGHIALFDCLGKSALAWNEPDPAMCEAVAVDHVHHRGDNPIVIEAAAWCAKHNIPLWLAETSFSDLEATGIGKTGRVIELSLDRMSAKDAGAGLSLSRRSRFHAN